MVERVLAGDPMAPSGRPERLALRVNEAAELLGVSRTLVYELINSGDLPVIRFGTAVRIPLLGLKEWVERRSTGGPDAA